MSARGRLRRILATGLVAFVALAVPAAALAGTAPVVVGAVSDAVNMSGTTSVAVSGGFAYATAYHAGELAAVNVSNPAAPVLTTTGAAPLQTNLIGGSNVAIAGGYAFVVSKNRNASTSSNDDGNGNSLTILDVHTDPTHPAVVGHIRDTGKLFGAYGVAVAGGYAYVAYQGVLSGQPSVPDTSLGGFTVINISNPAAPSIVANIDNPPSGTWTNAFKHATSVQISGHYAYVNAFNDDRLTVVDISNPASPAIVASLRDTANLSFPADIALQSHYAFVANQNSGGATPEFTVVDVANPLAPIVVGTVTNALLDNAYRVRVRGDFAYVAARHASAVAAIDISDPTHPRLAGAVQDAGHLNSTTGLDLDPSGRYVIASSPYRPGESNVTYPPYPDAGGPTNTGTISAIDMVPNPIAATIAPASEPPNPTAQTTASFSFSTNDDVSAVACSLDGATPGPCTSPTTQSYSGLAPGSHTFTVQATDSSGHTASASYTWLITAPPANASPPSISGTATQGQTLTASPGGWTGSPAPTFTYAWQRCSQAGTGCGPISGATGQSYGLTRADVGSTLKAMVTGTNSTGSATATSGASAIVTGPPVSTASPAISGRPLIGNRLTATNGTWTGYPAPALSDQWQRCNAKGASCRAIGGATGTSYTVSAADLGATLRFAVGATNSAGSAAATSSATGKVAASAKATLRGVKTRHVSITLSAFSPRPGSGLTKITVTLPKGLTFAKLRSGVHVVGANRHKVKFTFKLIHGALTITLKSPASAVTVTLDSSLIRESAPLAKAIKTKHQKRISLTVALAGTHGLSARDPLSATVVS